MCIFFSVYLLILITYNRYARFYLSINKGKGSDEGNRPKRRILSRLGRFFLRIFYILTTFIIFRFLGSIYGEGWGGWEWQNRPKWRKTRRLGPRCVFLPLFFAFFVAYLIYLGIFSYQTPPAHSNATSIPLQLAFQTSWRGFYLNKQAQMTVLSFGP